MDVAGDGAPYKRLLRAYGTRVDRLMHGMRCRADLTEAELRYLVNAEWARTAADVVWRRSKLGLRLSAGQNGAIDDAMTRMMPKGAAAA